MPEPRPFVAAAVQAAPVFMDRDATVEKGCRLIAEAAANGARLIVLPEAFVPAYPSWMWTLPLSRRPDVATLYRALVENSLDVPGPEAARLGEAARKARAWVAIGVNERNSESSGTSLFNTLLLFDDTGRLVEKRRKLMPTGAERMVWSIGEAVPLRVHDTPLGRLSSLLCWENYMPLARYALYERGTQVHLAPTWDKSDQWIAGMRHIAREGRMFVIGCCQALHRDQVPDHWPFKDTLPADMQWINVGNSLIVDPDGLVLAGPVAEQETTLYAEIDPGRASGLRWIFDAAGHYNRPDLFTFSMRGGEPPAGGAKAVDATARRPRRAAKSEPSPGPAPVPRAARAKTGTRAAAAPRAKAKSRSAAAPAKAKSRPASAPRAARRRKKLRRG
jgi:nitrilase